MMMEMGKQRRSAFGIESNEDVEVRGNKTFPGGWMMMMTMCGKGRSRLL